MQNPSVKGCWLGYFSQGVSCLGMLSGQPDKGNRTVRIVSADSKAFFPAKFFLSCFGVRMVLAYLSGHHSACKYKQNERASKIAGLPAVYHASLTSTETSILATPLDKLVANIKKGEVKPIEVLHAYGKEAIRAHAETNCLTEIMIEDAEKWATEGEIKGPLAGIPGTSIWRKFD